MSAGPKLASQQCLLCHPTTIVHEKASQNIGEPTLDGRTINTSDYPEGSASIVSSTRTE